MPVGPPSLQINEFERLADQSASSLAAAQLSSERAAAADTDGSVPLSVPPPPGVQLHQLLDQQDPVGSGSFRFNPHHQSGGIIGGGGAEAPSSPASIAPPSPDGLARVVAGVPRVTPIVHRPNRPSEQEMR